MMVLRVNINNRLRELFFTWLAHRYDNEQTHRYDSTYHRPPYQQRLNFADEEIDGIIYFYEWSDVHRPPTTYFTLRAFENFLDKSGIYVPSYQWELIKHIHNPYIACMKGGKELIIKTSYDGLKNALEWEASNKDTNPFRSTGSPLYNPMAKGSEDREPYSVEITRVPCSQINKPPMYREVDNRYPDMEEVADWWG